MFFNEFVYYCIWLFDDACINYVFLTWHVLRIVLWILFVESYSIEFDMNLIDLIIRLEFD